MSDTPCKEPRRALLSKEFDRLIPGRFVYVVRLRCGGKTVCPRLSFPSFLEAARVVLDWLDLGARPDAPDANVAAQSETAEGYNG